MNRAPFPILLLLVGPLYAQAPSSIQQTTKGGCSPIVTKVEGNVTIEINCPRLPPHVVDQLTELFSDENLEQILKSLTRLNELLDLKDRELAEVNREVEQWIQRYKTLKQNLRLQATRTEDERLTEALTAVQHGDLDQAQHLLEALRHDQRIESAEAEFNLGTVYALQLDFSKAVKAYQEAARLDPQKREYQNEVGMTFYTLGQYDKAIGYFEQALERDLQTFGPDHPNVATDRNNLGLAWYAKGKYDKAIKYYEKALESDLQTFGLDHPNVVTDRNNLGLAWKAKGKYDKAIGYFEQALERDLQTFGPDHFKVARDRNNLGSARHAKRVLDTILKSVSDQDHLKVAIARQNLGEAWRAKGEYDKAIGYYEQALAGFLKILGKDHPYTTKVRNNLSEVKKQSSKDSP